MDGLDKGALKPSDIKGTLTLIHDQAEAQETEIEKKQAEIEHRDKRITELELKLRKQDETHVTRDGDRLDKVAERILKTFFDASDNEDDGIVSFAEIAQSLGLQKAVVQGHCDVLFEREMIMLMGIDAAYIIANGRAYVMKYLLG